MRIHAIIDEAPAQIRAAFETPEMRAVRPILNKIKTEMKFTDFPIKLSDLDSLLAGADLKPVERMALKSALDRASLLKKIIKGKVL
jgi:hypothetical protein